LALKPPPLLEIGLRNDGYFINIRKCKPITILINLKLI